MGSNTFGTIFRITTWGESHGKAIGVVIDGCPAGLTLLDSDIQEALDARAPGNSPYTSPRKEGDKGEILSGVFEGKTTGAPICIMIPNRNADSTAYEPIKNLLRPCHANFTYLEKYGIFDYRGGGRASARETACRVAAGSVAAKWLKGEGIEILAELVQVGEETDEEGMKKALEKAIANKDSLGGIVSFTVKGLPAGFGDPVYEKLEANLGHAMMTIPASKGFEIGLGFASSALQGSSYNDLFTKRNGKIETETNHSGGILAGISTGMPIFGRVVFKPTSSIGKPQSTRDLNGEEATFELPGGSRHDPCVAIRAVPVVSAMAALVIADALLLNRCARL